MVYGLGGPTLCHNMVDEDEYLGLESHLTEFVTINGYTSYNPPIIHWTPNPQIIQKCLHVKRASKPLPPTTQHFGLVQNCNSEPVRNYSLVPVKKTYNGGCLP